MSDLTTSVTIVIDTPWHSNGCRVTVAKVNAILSPYQRLLSMIGLLQWLFFEFLLPSNSYYGCRIILQ